MALSALLAPPALGLLFHSSHVVDQWDTWAFVENSTFYAFYLVLEPDTWFSQSFGVATSADGVHFTDHGVVFTGRCLDPPCPPRPWPRGFWMGSGSVWRAAHPASAARYVVNWSQERGLSQTISFALSDDLLTWRASPTVFPIDPRYYTPSAPNGVRWDGIYSLPADPAAGRDAFPRLGYWTATPAGCGPYGLCNHTMGFGASRDGLTWEARPSPRMEPPTVHWSEVGAVERIAYRNGTAAAYFALLGGNAENQLAEMVTYAAARPDGPFRAATRNRVLLPKPSCYFARFFRGGGGELLVTHQSFSRVGRAYVAPFKAARVDDDATLRLAWWEGNQRLKGRPVRVRLDAEGSLLPRLDPSVGAVLEASFPLPPAGATLLSWPGFVFEQADGGATLLAVDAAARCAAANVTSAAPPSVLHTWDRELPPLPAGELVVARLLYRRDMLELYVNDVLLPVYLLPPTTGSVRVVNIETQGAAADRIRRWDMSL